MEDKKPNTLFICCCDNRIIADRFTSKKQGDLLILRNIGNLVPPYKAPDTSVAAAIEYGVEVLELPEIIVCGHSDCGGMKSAFARVEAHTCLGNWIQYAVPIEDFSSPDELSKANVFHQVENLMTYPSIQKAVKEDKLTINAWWYDLDDHLVYCYDDQTGEWNLVSEIK